MRYWRGTVAVVGLSLVLGAMGARAEVSNAVGRITEAAAAGIRTAEAQYVKTCARPDAQMVCRQQGKQLAELKMDLTRLCVKARIASGQHGCL